MPNYIENISDLPDESEFYNTISDGILFVMSKLQARSFINIRSIYLLIFIDGAFYSASKCSYHVITMLSHNIYEDCFHTMVYDINNKKTSSFIELLDNFKSYLNENRENKSLTNLWDPVTILIVILKMHNKGY